MASNAAIQAHSGNKYLQFNTNNAGYTGDGWGTVTQTLSVRAGKQYLLSAFTRDPYNSCTIEFKIDGVAEIQVIGYAPPRTYKWVESTKVVVPTADTVELQVYMACTNPNSVVAVDDVTFTSME